MPVSADAIRRLSSLGLTIEQIAGVIEVMDEAEEARKVVGRERTRRHRERHATQRDVTLHAVTADYSELQPKQPENDAASRAHVVILSSEEEERTIPSVCQESQVPKKPNRSDIAGSFQSFWTAYPQRKGANPRKPAADKFAAAVKSGAAPEQIVAAAERYADECRTNGQIGTPFVAQAVTWLNQRRFQDYAAPPVASVDDRAPIGWRPGMPTDEELMAKYSSKANVPTEPDSRVFLRNGQGPHREVEADAGRSVVRNPAGNAGMDSVGDIFRRTPALAAFGDENGSDWRYSIDDRPGPMA